MRIALSPIDTWFFRDATPFTKDASPQAGVVGVFPPHPPTVIGAIRAELARRRGWNGRGSWPEAMIRVLGDGPDALGALQFTGPVVLHHGEPVFPMPRHVVGKTVDGAWHAMALLRPGSEVQSDLGPRRLPVLPDGITERLRACDDAWVTLAGVQNLVRGELPACAHLVAAEALWTGEPRIGIERDPLRRATVEGALYSTRHVRPRRGTSLGIQVDGLPDGWDIPPDTMLPLGGESRLAGCTAWTEPLALPPPKDLGDTVTLIALTPLLIDRPVLRGEADLAEIAGRVIAACVERPLRIGGWDARHRAPIKLRNALPAGSTLFCSTRNHPRSGLVRVGAATNGGFGLCAVARLPREENA